MIPAIAILLCAIEISVAHWLDLSLSQFMTVGQIELVLLAMLGVMMGTSLRDKSVMTVFLIWFGWIAASDWTIDYLDPLLVQYEATAFSFLVLWALARPYFYPSADLTQRGENVYIGFYQGTHAPFLSSLAALFGLPFSSMVIVAGDKVLRSSASGKMVINSTALLCKGDFTLVDTKKIATQEIMDAIIACEGLPTKAFGILKTKCIRNCEPVLELLGLKPSNRFRYMPSFFYSQVVRVSHARK